MKFILYAVFGIVLGVGTAIFLQKHPSPRLPHSTASVDLPAPSSHGARPPAASKVEPAIARIPMSTRDAPPARKTWGNPSSLADHFARHGGDFRAKDAEEYARMAWQFGQLAKQGHFLVKVDDDGVQRVFDPRTGAFAAYNANGTTKTYFKPNNRAYFTRQPGRLLNSRTP